MTLALLVALLLSACTFNTAVDAECEGKCRIKVERAVVLDAGRPEHSK